MKMSDRESGDEQQPQGLFVFCLSVYLTFNETFVFECYTYFSATDVSSSPHSSRVNCVKAVANWADVFL